MAYNIPLSYYSQLANVESSGNPDALASTSSASGLFQFIKSTGSSLGLNWGSDSSQPFGGAFNSIGAQLSAADTFTQQNASALSNAGLPVNGNTLYAAHFLGAGQAINVLQSNSQSALSSILPSNVINANPFLGNMTVGDFTNWITNKGGGSFNASGSFPKRRVYNTELASKPK